MSSSSDEERRKLLKPAVDASVMVELLKSQFSKALGVGEGATVEIKKQVRRETKTLNRTVFSPPRGAHFLASAENEGRRQEMPGQVSGAVGATAVIRGFG